MGRGSVRATVETAWTALGAALGFVPFVPRLVRAAFTGREDRAATAVRLRAAAGVPPAPPPVTPRPLHVFLVAGEPSGDLHASNLARALARLCPGAVLEGIGGPRMSAAGVAVLEDLVSDPVMGVWPVVRRAPALLRLYRDLLVRLETDPPDVMVGIDYPGLNLRLARAARRRGVPFVEYVAPQVWAWAPWRLRTLAWTVDLLLPILPFESAVFEAAGIRAPYVGHPLIEHLERRGLAEDVVHALRAGPGAGPLVALLPGSRRSEVHGNLPVMLDAARRIAAARPGARFVVALAGERIRDAVESELRAAGVAADVAAPDRAEEAMAAADAAITVSGTATLHLAYHGVPCVVVYRASATGRRLAGLLLTTPWFALPNLVAGEEVVPERLVGPDDGVEVAEALVSLLPGGTARDRAVAGLRRVRERLTFPGVSDRVAAWVVSAARPVLAPSR